MYTLTTELNDYTNSFLLVFVPGTVDGQFLLYLERSKFHEASFVFPCLSQGRGIFNFWQGFP